MVPEVQVRKVEILHDLCTGCSTNLTFATPVFIKAIGRFGSSSAGRKEQLSVIIGSSTFSGKFREHSCRYRH